LPVTESVDLLFLQDDIGQWVKGQITILFNIRLTIVHFGKLIGRHGARIGFHTSVV